MRKMAKHQLIATGFVLASTLAGCGEGVSTYQPGPNALIAAAFDAGSDKIGLENGDAAIAYDPDGCQGWIIDDGAEGYSGRRFDPVTGLPVCDSLYPPGTVIGRYQSSSEGMIDLVPRSN